MQTLFWRQRRQATTYCCNAHWKNAPLLFAKKNLQCQVGLFAAACVSPTKLFVMLLIKEERGLLIIFLFIQEVPSVCICSDCREICIVKRLSCFILFLGCMHKPLCLVCAIMILFFACLLALLLALYCYDAIDALYFINVFIFLHFDVCLALLIFRKCICMCPSLLHSFALI